MIKKSTLFNPSVLISTCLYLATGWVCQADSMNSANNVVCEDDNCLSLVEENQSNGLSSPIEANLSMIQKNEIDQLSSFFDNSFAFVDQYKTVFSAYGRNRFRLEPAILVEKIREEIGGTDYNSMLNLAAYFLTFAEKKSDLDALKLYKNYFNESEKVAILMYTSTEWTIDFLLRLTVEECLIESQEDICLYQAQQMSAILDHLIALHQWIEKNQPDLSTAYLFKVGQIIDMMATSEDNGGSGLKGFVLSAFEGGVLAKFHDNPKEGSFVQSLNMIVSKYHAHLTEENRIQLQDILKNNLSDCKEYPTPHHGGSVKPSLYEACSHKMKNAKFQSNDDLYFILKFKHLWANVSNQQYVSFFMKIRDYLSKKLSFEILETIMKSRKSVSVFNRPHEDGFGYYITHSTDNTEFCSALVEFEDALSDELYNRYYQACGKIVKEKSDIKISKQTIGNQGLPIALPAGNKDKTLTLGE